MLLIVLKGLDLYKKEPRGRVVLFVWADIFSLVGGRMNEPPGFSWSSFFSGETREGTYGRKVFLRVFQVLHYLHTTESSAFKKVTRMATINTLSDMFYCYYTYSPPLMASTELPTIKMSKCSSNQRRIYNNPTKDGGFFPCCFSTVPLRNGNIKKTNNGPDLV